MTSPLGCVSLKRRIINFKFSVVGGVNVKILHNKSLFDILQDMQKYNLNLLHCQQKGVEIEYKLLLKRKKVEES